MKHYKNLMMLAFGALFLQGCIAFPPLVQVEHKQVPAPPPAPAAPSNEEVLRRLDSIDHRLDQLEKKQNESK